ncbi:ARL2_Bind_BART domain-containing protein [Meloidogyne graminicola]|uniref:Cilia- and flagella-associated protein 36 n=1 Tax=Meloidogyne graminicola TaxID=189291 RepID=A0A8S9ZVR1_9BILA|nr:ARL2_Bind_BART domain-containing protein [Meloidogyne graminicola]
MTKKSQNELFDYFMEFLRSDLWQIPINQFIEQRSIVFEREPDLSSSPNTVESFYSIHNEFTKIVNDLVNAYCDDCNQNREKIMEALKIVYQEKFQQMTNKDKMIIEPIVASEHFDVFVPMMMRKNIELQLQALKMIEQHMKGLLPNSLKLGDEDAKLWEALDAEEKDESERLILLAVLRQSKEEWENDQRMRADSEGQMERALHESLAEKSHLEEMRLNEQLLLEKAINEKLKNMSINSNIAETSKIINPNLSSSINKLDIKPQINKEKYNEENINNNNNSNENIKEIKRNVKGSLQIREQLGSAHYSDPGSSRKSPELKNPTDTEIRKLTQGEVNNNKIINKNNKSGEENEKRNKKIVEKVDKKRRSLGDVHNPSHGKKTIVEDQNNNNDLAYRSLLKKRENISDENIQSRMRYLKEQRDKLLQKKSMERQKQIMSSIDESRPRTAQAAKGLMKQKNSSELEERRRVAAKIKAEVIDKHQTQTIEQT